MGNKSSNRNLDYYMSEVELSFEEIKVLVNSSRNKIYTIINTEMLKLYWNIGKIIMEIQQGNERAVYGELVLEKLSQKLINEFGKGEDLCPSMSLQHHAILGWKQF